MILVVMARMLVEAGATPLSAVRAAVALERGDSVADAADEIELREEVMPRNT